MPQSRIEHLADNKNIFISKSNRASLNDVFRDDDIPSVGIEEILKADEIDIELSCNTSCDECSDSDSEDPYTDKAYGSDGNVNMWLVDINFLIKQLSEIAVCKQCGSTLDIKENRTYRAGLATKLSFLCSSEKCNQMNDKSFFTSNKTGKTFDVNSKVALAFRAIGKGRTAIEKVTSIVGMSTPVSRLSYSKINKNLEDKSFDLMQESIKRAGVNVRKIARKSLQLEDNDDFVNIATSFDGSWKSRGWTSLKGMHFFFLI